MNVKIAATTAVASTVIVTAVSKKIINRRAAKREAVAFEETVRTINEMMNKQDGTENVVHVVTTLV